MTQHDIQQRHTRIHRSRAAFTLIEISAVLVIIALLIGGILTGKSLIHSSNLHTVLDDAKTYNISLQLFKDKYGDLPGDFATASHVWSGTVNGNGNGIIEYSGGGGATSEAFQAWLHLQKAGMIKGNYTGASGPANGEDYQFGGNAPGSSFDLTGWMVAYLDNTVMNSGHMFKADYRKWLGIGSRLNGNDPSWADDGFLTNADAYEIDKKIDDGKPFLGMVHGMGLDTGCTNATSNTNVTADYVLSSATENACALLFSYDLVAPKRF